MTNDSRFIPITVSLDGSQAEAGFAQLGDRIAAIAKQTGQAIIDASKDVYTKIIASNESAFARYRDTQFQMAEIAKQTLEIQQQTAQKISEVSRATDRLSGSLSRLTAEIQNLGEAGATSLAKYSRGAAALQTDIDNGFKQFADRLTSTATQIGQAILNSSSAQSSETLHQMDEAARQSSEMCERIVDKMGEVAEQINKLSEGFERLGEKLGESGEKGEAFITKYHEYTASIHYTIEILKELPHLLKEGKAKVIEFGESAVNTFGKVKGLLSNLTDKASTFLSNLSTGVEINSITAVKDELGAAASVANNARQSMIGFVPVTATNTAAVKTLTGALEEGAVAAGVEAVAIDGAAVSAGEATLAFLGMTAALILIPAAIGLIAYGIYKLITYSQEFKTATLEEIDALNKKIETLNRAREATDHYKEGQAQSEKTSHTLLDAYHLLNPAAQSRIANAKDETEAIKILNEERAKESGLLGQAQNQQAADIIHAFQTQYQEYKQALNDLDSAYQAKNAGPQRYTGPLAGTEAAPLPQTQDQLNQKYDTARASAVSLQEEIIKLAEKYKGLTQGSAELEKSTFEIAQSQYKAKGTSEQFKSAIAEVTRVQFPLIGKLQDVKGELGNVEFQAIMAQHAIADLLAGGPEARVNAKIQELALKAAKYKTTGYEPGLEGAAKSPEEFKQQLTNIFLNKATSLAYDVEAIKSKRDNLNLAQEMLFGETAPKRPAGGGGGRTTIKAPTFDLQSDIARARHELDQYNKTIKETTAEQQLYERLIDSVSPKEKKRIADLHDLQQAITEVDKLKPHENIRKQSEAYIELNRQLDEKRKKEQADNKIKDLVKQQNDQLRDLKGPETALEKINRLLLDPEIATNIDKQTAARLRWNATYIDIRSKVQKNSENIKSILANYTEQLQGLELQKIEDPIEKLNHQIEKIRKDLPKYQTPEDQANVKKLEETWVSIRREIQEGIDKRKNDETIRKYNDQVKQLNDQLLQGEHLTQRATLERRLQNKEFGELNSLQVQHLRDLTREVEEQQKLEEETKKVKDTLTNAFQQGLEHGPKAFFKSLFDTFRQTLIKMESEWAASKVMEFLYPSKSGESTKKGGLLQSIFDRFGRHDKQAPGGSTQHSVSVTKVPDAATAENTSSLNGLTLSIRDLIQALQAFSSGISNGINTRAIGVSSGQSIGGLPAQIAAQADALPKSSPVNQAISLGSGLAGNNLPRWASQQSPFSGKNNAESVAGKPVSDLITQVGATDADAQKKSAAINQSVSIGTSFAGKNLSKWMTDHSPFSGSKKPNANDAAAAKKDSSAKGLNFASAGLSILQNLTNSGGTMGNIESGMMMVGQSLGFTPAGIALMGGAIGLGLLGKAFGWGRGDQKAIHDAILHDPFYGKEHPLDIKNNKLLDQIKQIGDQKWPGKVKEHVTQLIHDDQVKDLIFSVEQYDLDRNPNFKDSDAARTRLLADVNNPMNAVRISAPPRAMGGPVAANMPYLVGEKRPELFIPRVDGAIHPDPIGDMTRRVMDNARAKMSTPAGNQGHSQNALGFAIQSLVEQLSRLTAISPGQVLQTGARQNPTAISGGLIEGLRQNFGHRRELNGITGA